MTKVFLDASVIIAALLSPSGGSAKVIEFARQRLVVGIVSQTVIFEVEAKSAKIKRSEVQIGEFINKNRILVRGRINLSQIEPYVGKVELDDAHVVAGAQLTKCDYLVTLDKKHLLREDIRREFKPLKIVSPKEILEELG